MTLINGDLSFQKHVIPTWDCAWHGIYAFESPKCHFVTSTDKTLPFSTLARNVTNPRRCRADCGLASRVPQSRVNDSTIQQSTIKHKIIMAKLSIKPLADRVVIEPAAAEQKTASGIIIPDTAKEKPQQGKVVAVGPGTKDNAMTLKVGDNVIYGKYAGTEFHLDGKDYMIMRENDVIAII